MRVLVTEPQWIPSEEWRWKEWGGAVAETNSEQTKNCHFGWNRDFVAKSVRRQTKKWGKMV